MCRPHKKSCNQGGFTLIELIIVVCMIAVLMVVSLKYYQNVMDRAQRTGMQMLSSRFDSTMTVLHMKWKFASMPSELISEETVYQMNDRGWPVGARADFIEAGQKDCQQLWQAVFKNPGKLLDFLPKDDAGMQFWMSYPEKGVCRYQMVTAESQRYYFDYNSLSGSVKVTLN
ncbi:MAG: prepilin-type N-terminal cleavage/methylation domain-containing protein [Candidatus Pelagadaptatus aseana]|uniref:type IV pilin protein n=1 Tax=Candidatus Pelagadaptatus aseana TaxID=3120508 RepID=UPI0039B1F81B